MTTMRKIETPNGAVAFHQSPGRGPAIILLHSNSTSSPAFIKQLDGRARYRHVAMDLPGHGGSDDPRDPALYRMKMQAQTLKAAIETLE